MATVQVIHISLLCCHILHPNNSAAVFSHFRSTLIRQLYTDKDSRCGMISSPFTYTFISHWMAGMHIIWFSVPITCKNANVTTLQHFLTIYCQYAHVFCIQQWSVHVVHYKRTDKLNLIVSPKVWRPCKWFTFHCYVVISCILTTVRHFSTTTGPYWNISYTLIKTAGVVHYRSAVRSCILSSVTEWQTCILSDFQCRLHAYMQM